MPAPVTSKTSIGPSRPLTGMAPSDRVLDVALGERGAFRRWSARCARGGDLLHPRGEMRGLADRGVVHAQVVADRAHDDLAGVQADADLDRTPSARRTSSA